MKIKLTSPTRRVNLKPSTTRKVDPERVRIALGADEVTMEEELNRFFGKAAKPRVSDDLWLTPRCQRVVNDFNSGKLTMDAAVMDLRAVGNTEEQAKAILERHRGRDPVKVKRPKKADPLRRVKG